MSSRPRAPAGLTRRAATSLGAAALAAPAAARGAGQPATPRWGVHEIALRARAPGNPFEVELWASFTDGRRRLRARGFYDGDGIWRVRFSPPDAGTWRWVTESPLPALNGKRGAFAATGPRPGDHGPLRVVGGYHFAHADGAPFRQVGTTAYAWAQQSDELCAQTLQTLAAAPFNKLRMCVFPNVPARWTRPFQMDADGRADLDRPDPAYFRTFEDRVRRLGQIGVQADVILYHPYAPASDFHRMTPAQDAAYVRYLVARLAAFSNVWWSLANEWDLLKEKSEADFERIGQLIAAEDPYGRMRSIHNCHVLFDNARPWITHASIQDGSAVRDDTRAEIFRSVWRKPVIFDEVCYEGSLDKRWGDLKPEQMVERFWHGLTAGTYVGHGEVYDAATGWTARGGRLAGSSAPRLQFLREVMEAGPVPGLEPIDKWWDRHIGGQAGRYYLRYFGQEAPDRWDVALPAAGLEGGERFRLDLLDTWNMTVTPVGAFTMAARDPYTFHDPARPQVVLPGRSWMAVRMVRLDA